MHNSKEQALLSKQIQLLRMYLKLKIMDDNVSFKNHSEERDHIYNLIKKTVVNGESHSALLMGPRGSGKTTLINSVLNQLNKEVDLQNDAIIVKLNGLVHSDEKIALKSITAQYRDRLDLGEGHRLLCVAKMKLERDEIGMQLENAVGDRVFGTFAENLSYLLSCLQSGADRRCRSTVMVLEECDMFCKSGRTQTLLYNLFDVTHTKASPMCVIGVTSRIDIMELFEKRVKSRFSHRHINIFPNEIPVTPVEKYKCLFIQLLSMPMNVPIERTPKKKKRTARKSLASEDIMEVDTEQYALPHEIISKNKVNIEKLDSNFLQEWNQHIKSVANDENVINDLEKLCYYTINEQIYRNILFQLVSKLSQTKPYIDTAYLNTAIDNTVAPESRVKLLQSLSILELSLVIAIKHGMDILDGQPMNFEMVLHRYTKFANSNSSTQSVPRPVVLKAFEHLQALEIIMPLKTADSMYSDTTTSRVQKEYKLVTLSVPVCDISEAIKGFKALPTEISYWFNNSVI